MTTNHPLHARSWQMAIYQGIGRSANTPEIMKPVIRQIVALELTELRNYRLACIAFFLSRRDKVFDLINTEEQRRFVQISSYYLVEGQQLATKPYSQLYSYTLLLIGGLLRFRTRDPFAFIPDACGLGRELNGALKKLWRVWREYLASTKPWS